MSDPIDVVRQKKREDAMKREFLIAPDPFSCVMTRQNKTAIPFSPPTKWEVEAYYFWKARWS